MSRLDELIKELCPDGVEWHTIDDISLFVTVGIANSATHAYSNSGVIMFRNQNINPNYLNDNDLIFITDDFSEKYKNKKLKENDILVTRTGYPGQACVVPKKYEGCQTFTTLIVRLRNFNKTLPEYVCQYINSGFGKEYVDKTKSGAAQQNFGATSLAKMSIPIPPIEVQREIVKILDAYSESVSSLQQELEKELIARKKQYEYYRDFLLDFEVHEGAEKECEWRTIGEMFPFIRNGFVGTVTPFYTNKENGVRYLQGTNIHNGVISDNEVLYVNKEFHLQHNRTELKPDDILVVQSGTPSHVGECAVVGNHYAGANCHALIVMSNGGLCNSKYITYYLHSKSGKKQLKKITTGETVRHILASAIQKIYVPIPPIEEQERIVSLLERFDELCNDITEGLPAEIEARQKQYEYYRDKLLTFKEKKEA